MKDWGSDTTVLESLGDLDPGSSIVDPQPVDPIPTPTTKKGRRPPRFFVVVSLIQLLYPPY